MSGRRRWTLFLFSVGLLLGAGCGGKDRSSAAAGATSADIAKGRDLFKRSGCPVCHGEEGRGDGPTARSLVPPPRNLHDASSYRQGHEVEEIVQTIKTGLSGTMPGYPYIPEEDRRRLALFVKSLQGQR